MRQDIDDILARFPGPVTLNASRLKWLAVLLICALFTAGGVWQLTSGSFKGWCVFGFFGLGTLVSAVAVLPGASALILDRDGFETTALFRRHRSRWRDTTGFTVISIPKAVVAYDDDQLGHGKLAQANVALFGRNAALPDTYRQSAVDLAVLMTRWRIQAMSRR